MDGLLRLMYTLRKTSKRIFIGIGAGRPQASSVEGLEKDGKNLEESEFHDMAPMNIYGHGGQPNKGITIK